MRDTYSIAGPPAGYPLAASLTLLAFWGPLICEPASSAITALSAPTLASAGFERDFTVFLDQRRIGTHRFSVQPAADDQHVAVTSDADFNVRLIGISAYRYRHHAAENWKDGCLADMRTSTDDNGTRTHIDAVTAGKHLKITGRLGKVPVARELAGCVMSYAYWNPRFLQRRELLNPQTGDFEAVTVTEQPGEKVEVRGQQVTARRYLLKTQSLAIDLWYSPEGEWLQLDSTTKDGKRLRYRLN